MPLRVATLMALAKRLRSVPNAAASRGASCSPAPGKLAKIGASGWVANADEIFSSYVAMLAFSARICATRFRSAVQQYP